MWIPVYECPLCDNTWRVSVKDTIVVAEEDDEEDFTEKDEITERLVCMICNSTIVHPKKDENGNPIYHLITDAELEEEDRKGGDFTSLDELFLDDDELNYIPEDFYDDEDE